MKILLVNGSPKASSSASAVLLKAITRMLGPDHVYSELNAKKDVKAGPSCLGHDAIVLAFPLYVDALPTGLLEWLLSYEAFARDPASLPGSASTTAIFAVCNCGFHEGLQTATALRVVRNFAQKLGLTWGGGLGIGAGGMLEGLAGVPDQAWIKRDVSKGMAWIVDGLKAWSEAAASGKPPSNKALLPGDSCRFVTHALPRFAYILAAHAGWRKEARANGLRPRELWARPIKRREGSRHLSKDGASSTASPN